MGLRLGVETGTPDGSGDGHRMYAGRCRGSFSRCRFSIGAALSGAAAMGLAGEYAAEQFQSHGSISQFSLGILDGLFSLRDAAALRMIPL